MAIIGGAVFTAVMGLVSRESSINVAYLVPAACFAIVFLFAWKSRRDPVTAAAARRGMTACAGAPRAGQRPDSK